MNQEKKKIFNCPKCGYDGRWEKNKSLQTSKYMKCFNCGKKWIPNIVSESKDHISVIDKVLNSIEF